MIITIDGPAGTGKTTVARSLAEELGFIYLDTGAMYRAITYGIMSHSIDPNDINAINAFISSHPVTVTSHVGEEKQIYLGDENCTNKIRTQEVTNLVSKISAYPSVREKLVATQRELASGVNAVVEGRDMGTVVFPKADVKIFMTADPVVRALRRHNELLEKDPNTTISFETVLADINARDAYDASRDTSPMKPASDAIIIDTSELTIDAVVNRIVNIKEKKEARERQ